MNFDVGACPNESALEAWRMMEDRINWSAIPVIVQLLGIIDVERFVDGLTVIREYVERVNASK